MLFSILVVIGVFVSLLILGLYVHEKLFDLILSTLFISLGVILILFLFNKQNLKNVECKITQYEIVYNSNQSKIVANYFSGELKIFDYRDLNNVKEIKDYKIVNDGDKALYIVYKKEKKGNFFHLSNLETKYECIIPIKVLESWK